MGRDAWNGMNEAGFAGAQAGVIGSGPRGQVFVRGVIGSGPHRQVFVRGVIGHRWPSG